MASSAGFTLVGPSQLRGMRPTTVTVKTAPVRTKLPARPQVTATVTVQAPATPTVSVPASKPSAATKQSAPVVSKPAAVTKPVASTQTAAAKPKVVAPLSANKQPVKAQAAPVGSAVISGGVKPKAAPKLTGVKLAVSKDLMVDLEEPKAVVKPKPKPAAPKPDFHRIVVPQIAPQPAAPLAAVENQAVDALKTFETVLQLRRERAMRREEAAAIKKDERRKAQAAADRADPARAARRRERLAERRANETYADAMDKYKRDLATFNARKELRRIQTLAQQERSASTVSSTMPSAGAAAVPPVVDPTVDASTNIDIATRTRAQAQRLTWGMPFPDPQIVKAVVPVEGFAPVTTIKYDDRDIMRKPVDPDLVRLELRVFVLCGC